MQPLETDRLLLRPLEEGDFEFLVRLHADPDVARYLSTGRPRSRSETHAWLDAMLAFGREHGLGHLCVIDKEDERRIGRSGLLLFHVEEPTPATVGRPLRVVLSWDGKPADYATTDELECGYALAVDAWGRGLATEAARAVRDHAMEALGAPRVMSVIHPDNEASKNVARKNGMARFDAIDVYGNPYERWLVTREEWERLPR